MKLNKRVVTGLALVAILILTLTAPVWAQVPVTNMRNVAIQVLRVTAGLTTDDLTTTDDVVVGDALTVVGNTAVSGNAALSGDLTLVPDSDLTLTMNGWITPTGTFQPVRSAGAVSISGANIADGVTGDLLILYNAGGQTITITETTGLISAGNIALGTLDSATLVYSGTTWIQIGASNN